MTELLHLLPSDVNKGSFLRFNISKNEFREEANIIQRGRLLLSASSRANEHGISFMQFLHCSLVLKSPTAAFFIYEANIVDFIKTFQLIEVSYIHALTSLGKDLISYFTLLLLQVLAKSIDRLVAVCPPTIVQYKRILAIYQALIDHYYGSNQIQQRLKVKGAV